MLNSKLKIAFPLVCVLLMATVVAPVFAVVTQLTHINASSHYPSISGDGSKIAFQSFLDDGYEIFVINSDGSGLKQLTSDGGDSPSISGDGSKIAFFSFVDGDTEIFVINSDGTGLTQLTNNTVKDAIPSISRDGTKIAYSSNVDGDVEIFLWKEENGTGEDGGADSGLSMTTIAIIAATIIVSIIAALYLIIRRRQLKK